MMRNALAVVLALLVGLAAGAAAQQRQTALGADGYLYQVIPATYGQISSDGALDPATPVLSLVVTEPSGTVSAGIVPGSEGEELQGDPTLVFEEASEGLFILWKSSRSYIHSQIRLARYADGAWSEPISLPGELFSLTTAPSLAVTRDLYFALDAAGRPLPRSRTIYHVLWWEAAGGERVVYCPVVLLDGVYVGWSPRFVLSDLGFGEPTPTVAEVTQELIRAPSIQPGEPGKSVVAGLVDPLSGLLVELEIEVVAGELGALAHEVHQTIIEDESAPAGPQGNDALADRARAQLIDIGARLRLHTGVVDYLAQDVLDQIFANPHGEAAPALADRARAQLIDLGARMAAQGVTQEATEGDLWLLEFPGTADAASESAAQPDHSLHLRLAAARPAPETEPGPTHLYLSRHGGEALVVWQVGDELRYRESSDAGWSAVRHLQLGPELDLERAHLLLHERTQSR